jgi:glycosyltransferase involved in cell wall biosynthesis
MSKVVAIVASAAATLDNFRGPLLDALVAAGARVVAFTPDLDPTPVARIRGRGVAIDTWPVVRTGTNPREDLAATAVLTRKLRRLRPDVVLTFTLKPNIYGTFAARAAGVPRVVSLITGLGFAFSAENLRARMVQVPVQALLGAALRRNDRVLVFNDDITRIYGELGLLPPLDRVVKVAGSGIDTAHFAQAPLPAGPPVFTLVARLLAAKGVREYAEAARVVRARYPEARFRLVGDYDVNPSSLRPDEVEAWVRDGVIEFLGHVADVRPVLAETTVFVLPSWAEGVSRATLEAMAVGRPVITTDAPGCRETIEDGVSGLLVPLRDPKSLAAAMERFVREPGLAAAMGAAARERAETVFDVHAVNAVVLDALGVAPPPPLAGVAARG